MKKGKRNWQPRELLLVTEYLQKNYSKYPYQTRVRLGSTPERFKGMYTSQAQERAVGVWRRWADAIVFKPGEIIIIEAAIRVDPGDISKLKLYKSLFPHTPEFEPYANLPISLELVTGIPDEVVAHLAKQEGIRVVEFKPDWLEEYLSILYPHERQAPLTNVSDLSKGE